MITLGEGNTVFSTTTSCCILLPMKYARSAEPAASGSLCVFITHTAVPITKLFAKALLGRPVQAALQDTRVTTSHQDLAAKLDALPSAAFHCPHVGARLRGLRRRRCRCMLIFKDTEPSPSIKLRDSFSVRQRHGASSFMPCSCKMYLF